MTDKEAFENIWALWTESHHDKAFCLPWLSNEKTRDLLSQIIGWHTTHKAAKELVDHVFKSSVED
jgi:hypothetical protein